jgi:hypothetical protein
VFFKTNAKAMKVAGLVAEATKPKTNAHEN